MVEKKIKNSKNIKKQQGIDINKLTTYFLTMILCAGFIFNGYFFERQILSVNIVVLAFLFYLVIVNGKNERYFYYNPWTIFLCSLFIIINFLGLCGAADLRAALDNFLLLASGVIIYLIVTQLETDSHKSLDYLKIMLKGIYWVSVFIAFVGLVSYIFGVNLLNSYQSDNRLISTLGYANTAALLFAMVFFIGFYLLDNYNDKDRIYCFTNSLVFLAFLGTKSRGVFLLFLFLIVLYFLLIKKENRPSFLKNFIYVFVPSLLVFPLFYNGTFISRDTKGIFLSSIAVLFLVMVAYLKKKVTFNTKKLLITGGIGLVIIFSFVFISVGHESVINAIADNDIIQRLKTINLEQQQVQERFIFVEDALKIVKDNLLLGTGGGGWKAEYRQYQTFLYHTSEVHNYYVQVLVENGILGFITYISFWVILILNYFKKLKKERSFE
ncbi:MAG: O-antigen ligase family protein, partial [Clostridia bacterium]|nr:O-antigen ligase family protein [Clostridia bacterium]